MIDLLYFAWNRRAFTEFTFERLLENTNWDLVGRLLAFEDRSTDGTTEYLMNRISDVPVLARVVQPLGERWGTSVAPLHDHVHGGGSSSLIATVENDLAVPPYWLEAMLDVMGANPALELLGMESFFNGEARSDWDGIYRYSKHTHIGGNGLMRLSAFSARPKFRVLNFTGFEVWQKEEDVNVGWIDPDIPVCLLDRLDFDPWKSLSEEYEALGWQRPWEKIPEYASFYWDWFPETV